MGLLILLLKKRDKKGEFYVHLRGNGKSSLAPCKAGDR